MSKIPRIQALICGSKAPDYYDVELMTRYWTSINHGLIVFLSTHCFKHSFRGEIIEPLMNWSYVWSASQRQFRDTDVQKAFAKVCEAVSEFNNMQRTMYFFWTVEILDY